MQAASSPYVLCIDVSTIIMTGFSSHAGLHLLRTLNNKSAQRMVRSQMLNPRVLQYVRSLQQSSNPPHAVVLMTDNRDSIGDMLALDAHRSPVAAPQLRGVVPLTYCLDSGEGRRYLVEQTGLKELEELSTLTWAIGKALKLPQAPRLYVARSGIKFLPHVAATFANDDDDDFFTGNVVLLDNNAEYHKARHLFSCAEDEQRYNYVALLRN